jgi:peptidoglycan/xylan/chitin deacetylase (PgdA/CDA1 family)
MDLVLLYHRIAPERRGRACVSIDHFVEQLDVLTHDADVVSLAQLVDERPSRSARPRVAITFDNGYGNSVTWALPELERRGVPATVFVVTGEIGSAREFWWDELEWLIRAAGCDHAESFTIVVDGRERTWILPAFDDPTGMEQRTRPTAGGLTRLAVYRDLHAYLMERETPDARAELLDALARSLGLARTARPERLPLTHGQLACLSRHPLVEIGAQTVDHPVLTRCRAAQQEWQVAESRRQLEQITGIATTSFAYPFGSYSPETIDIVRSAGFRRACLAGDRAVASAGEFEIPRLSPGDWDGYAFAGQLQCVLATFAEA